MEHMKTHCSGVRLKWLLKRRPRVVPGEMESVTLKRDFFPGGFEVEVRMGVWKSADQGGIIGAVEGLRNSWWSK